MPRRRTPRASPRRVTFGPSGPTSSLARPKPQQAAALDRSNYHATLAAYQGHVKVRPVPRRGPISLAEGVRAFLRLSKYFKELATKADVSQFYESVLRKCS